MYKQIAVVSGKGGTGKTTLSSSLIDIFDNVLGADCDVDASNLYLLFDPQIEKQHDYYGGKKAIIDNDKCTRCGLCQSLCNFNAIYNNENGYFVDEFACEGCNRCVMRCPVSAIELLDNRAGEYYKSSKNGTNFVHATLEPGEETSGGLVAEVRKMANKVAEEERNDYIVIDGAPGVGCPATSSITGVNYVVIVTEPSKSGIHDLERIVDTVKHFKRKFDIVINKYDINLENTEYIENYCKENGIGLLGKIPFDKTIVNATNEGKPVTQYDCEATKEIKSIANEIRNKIG